MVTLLAGAFAVYGRLATAETQLVGLHSSVSEVKGSVAGLRHEITGLALSVQSLADAVQNLEK